MTIEKLTPKFSVCTVENYSLVDLNSEFCFVGKTDKERSLVCLTEQVPPNVICREDGWRALRICGVLDFSLIGILAGISATLARAGVGIFAISTYETDYILIKDEQFERAIEALRAAEYKICE